MILFLKDSKRDFEGVYLLSDMKWGLGDNEN
jgi:hypothetical protein